MFARKHMLRWLTTPYRQPDPLPNSAKICPIKPNYLWPLSEALSMFARKHMVRWLTTAYRQPDPLPNSGACIYPRRHRRLITHAAPPSRAVRVRRHLEASRSEQSARRLSSAHPQPLRNISVTYASRVHPSLSLPLDSPTAVWTSATRVACRSC